MVKLGVLADSHRSVSKLVKALEMLNDCGVIVHLGDHDSDMDGFDISPERLISVPGNCDRNSFNPPTRIFEKEGVRVLVTHGDEFGVKYTTQRLFYKAKEREARLVLYGHSHRQGAEEAEGVLMLNPGALKNGEYARVTLDNGQISYELLTL